MPIRLINQLLSTWDSPDGPRCDNDNVTPINAYFFCYDRVLKNAGIYFDIKPAEQILNRIHYGMAVSRKEIETLRIEASRLLNLAVKVRDYRHWQQSMTDAEIYGHVHNWDWAGIGTAQEDAQPVSRLTH